MGGIRRGWAPVLVLGTSILFPSSVRAALGDPIDEAVAVQITADGLTSIGDAIEAMMPAGITVAAAEGEFSCDDSGQPLRYSVDELTLLLSVDEVALDPSDGRLDLHLHATLGSVPSSLQVRGDCAILTELDEVCGLELPTTALEFHLGMRILESKGEFDVVVDRNEFSISPMNNPLSDCTLASAFGAVLGQDPEGVSDLLLESIEPSLTGLGPEIEAALEDALGSLTMDVDVETAELALSLYPSLLSLDSTGLVVGMGATIEPSAVSECVDSSLGPVAQGTGWPTFSETAAGTSLSHDVALLVGRDFLDHLLYAAWAAGALCVDVSDYIDGGLDGGFWGSLLGDSFSENFAEDAPALLVVDPSQPPLIRFEDDGAPFRVDISDLGISLYSSLELRMVRVFEMLVETELGIDVELVDGTDLSSAVEFDPAGLASTESYNELIAPGFSISISSLLGSILGGALGDLAVPEGGLGDFNGLTLASIDWLPDPSGDWQGGYVILDTTTVVPIEITGCSAGSIGCDGGGGEALDFDELVGCSAGCEETSCATTGGPVGAQGLRVVRGRLGLVLFLGLGLVARRRRKSQQA